VIRRWGLPWYAIGIAGMIVFMAIWIITRMPGNLHTPKKVLRLTFAMLTPWVSILILNSQAREEQSFSEDTR
jgi:hypothetical protein